MLPSLPGLKTETRIARLDGIRELAVLLVFATHAQLLPLGWIGVQLFFVLSGLFITNILRRSRGEASYWPPFYIRRATRILPPLAIAFLGAALFSNIPWRQVVARRRRWILPRSAGKVATPAAHSDASQSWAPVAAAY